MKSNSILPLLLLIAISTFQTEGIYVPDEWKKILISICREIEGSAVVSPPMVRDVRTFRSAVTILREQDNTVRNACMHTCYRY